MAANKQQADPTASSNETNNGELEKIRSILFGEQIRSTEDRLSSLESQLMAKMDQAHKSIEARLDLLEKKLEERTRDLGDLQGGLDTCKQEFTTELKTLDKTLRDTIDAASNSVTKDVELKTDALSKAIQDSVGQLQEDKVNRSQLSALLSQLAQSLGD